MKNIRNLVMGIGLGASAGLIGCAGGVPGQLTPEGKMFFQGITQSAVHTFVNEAIKAEVNPNQIIINNNGQGQQTGFQQNYDKSYTNRNQFASVSNPIAKLKRGPGERYETLIEVREDYPLLIEKKAADWFLVRDYEGDRGWVKISDLDSDKNVISKTNGKSYEFPRVDSNVKFGFSKGVLFESIGKDEGWILVKSKDDETRAWIQKKYLWGKIE